MALLGKERAASSIPSTITVGISAIVIDLIANISKVFVLEVVKPELFYGSR
jgi:hypothetical protein